MSDLTSPPSSFRPRRRLAYVVGIAAAALSVVGAATAAAAPGLRMDRFTVSRASIGAAGVDASTKIGFRTSASGVVDVVVATPAGHVVRNLYRGTRPAGAASLIWNGHADNGRLVPDGDYDVLVSAEAGTAPVASLVSQVRVDTTPPKLSVPRLGGLAKLQAKRVWIRIPMTSSEAASAHLVASGGARGGYTIPVKAGSNALAVTTATLGIAAAHAVHAVHLTLVVTDASGNSSNATVQVSIPAAPGASPAPTPAPIATPTAPVTTPTAPTTITTGGFTTVQPFTVDAALPLRTRIVQIAQSQVGVVEVGNNGGPAVDAYRASVIGGTGVADTAWCAYFSSWVFNEAGAGLTASGHGDGLVANIGDWAKAAGRFMPPGTVPTAGDAVFTTGEGGHWTDHMGIVESVDPTGTIHTIEGNDGDGVRRASYAPTDPQIKGFMRAQ